MKKLILFAVILINLCACDTNNHSENSNNISVKENYTETDNQYCFLNTVEQKPIIIDGKIVQEMIDSTTLYFKINDKKVSGTYEYLPAEQDARIGSFEGEFGDDGKIIGLYTFAQEGETYNNAIIIELNGNETTVSLGEINITKTENATFDLLEEPIVLKEIECN